MSKRFSVNSPALADLVIVLLTLFAVAFAATNQLAGKAVLVLGAGALWLISPPATVDWRKAAIAVALYGWALLPLLPATMFGTPPWRETLTAAGATLPPTFTPQPWLTLEHALLLGAGLAWTLFLTSREWLVERRVLLGLYAAGMALLAVLWVFRVAVGAGLVPGEFGFFPNRNQSAHVLAVVGVVMLALALNGWRERRSLALAWLAPLLFVIVALLRAGSRAGILLFILGCGVWLLASGRLGLRVRWLPLIAAAAMLFAAVVFLFGERILARLPVGQVGGEITSDMRLRIWNDTWGFLRDGSWHGHGLGTFSPLFARYRDASINPDRVIHPESDWIWAATELGWPAVLLLAVLLMVLVRGCWPMSSGSGRLLRFAALVAASMTALHGLVDVSGHRVGSLWPALFLLGIATCPVERSGHAARGLRWVGLPLVALGAVWLAAAGGFSVLPTSADHERLIATTRMGLKERNYAAVMKAADAGLQLNPVNWEFWFARGAARAATVASTVNARADFAVARWLEPNAKVAFEEGRSWLIREGSINEDEVFFGPEPRLTVESWRAALAMNPVTFPSGFEQMIQSAREHPEIGAHVADLAADHPQRLAAVVIGLPAVSLTNTLARLLAVDPTLAEVEPTWRRRIFREWFQRGDRTALESFLMRHPEWMPEAWPVVGEILAGRGEFQEACGLALKYLPATEITVVEEKPIARARADHLSNPRDVVAGLAYLQALQREGDVKEMLRILPMITSSGETPAYVHDLAGRFWLQHGNPTAAWKSFRRAAGN